MLQLVPCARQQQLRQACWGERDCRQGPWPQLRNGAPATGVAAAQDHHAPAITKYVKLGIYADM